MSASHPDSKDPTAPAQPDAARLPHAPYHPVLAGQPALVTGANSGIGKAVALGLARAGADVAVNYVTHPETAEDGRARNSGHGPARHRAQGRCQQRGRGRADVRRRHRGIRHAAHRRQQRRAAARFAVRHHDAGAVEHGDRGEPDRPVPVHPRRHARVQAARRGAVRLQGRRQDHLHEFGAPADPVGRPRQLRRLEGRHHDDDEKHRPGTGAALHPREQHRRPAPSARRSTPQPGTRLPPMPT